MPKLPRFLTAPFWQALLAVVLACAGTALLLLNDMGTGCFHAGGCGGNTFLMLSVAVAVLGALVAGGWAARAGFSVAPAGRPGWQEGLALAVVLAVAGLLRLGLLGQIPGWLDYDTAQNGWIALTLWEQLPEKGVQPVLLDWATGNETAYIYLVGASLKLLGVSVEALRLPSAIVGTLTVAAVYLLGRAMFSARVGLVAAFFAALCPWHIMHSRMATRPVLTALFVALGLLLLHRGLLARPGRRSWAYLVGCGLLLGAGLHGYEAFRLFPLAVAAGLVWTRLRQGLLRRGLLELCVVAGCAVLVTLPIFIFAMRHPEAYMEHVSTNSIVHAVKEAGSLWPLVDNLTTTLGFLIFALPATPHQDYPGALPLLVLGPLFVAGLVGLVLARRPGAGTAESAEEQKKGKETAERAEGAEEKDGEAREKRGREVDPLALARFLILLTLALMAAPFLLARFSNLAPRRYMGELVPFYLLAGAAAAGILRGLRQKIGPWGIRVVTLLGAAALLSALPSVADALRQYMPYHRQPRAERILRWCLTLTDEHEIYLAPDLVGHGYLSRFFLKHPRVRRLPTAWPLPRGPLEQSVMLVGRGEPWWTAPLARLKAIKEQVTLDLPLTEPKQARLTLYWVDREILGKLRLKPADLSRRYSAHLLAPRPGAYAFAAAGDATLTVGGRKTGLGPGRPEVTVALAAGPVPITFTPAGGPLRWRPPGAAAFSPVPAAALWRLSGLGLPPAPRPGGSPLTLTVAHKATVPVFPAYVHSNSMQDLACHGGRCYVVDLDRYPVKRWTRAAAMALEPVLHMEGGKPLTLEARYDPESYKALSLAVSRRGYFLLDRAQRTIRRFSPAGKDDGLLVTGAARPLDLSATDEALYVADPGQGAVLECVPSGKWAGRPFLTAVDPVALSTSSGRLAVLDRRRHQLRLVGLESGKLLRAVQLGQVNRYMRVSLDTAGAAVVTDTVNGRVLFVDASGKLLAHGGDPTGLGRKLAEETGDPPSRVLWDSQKGEVTYLGRSKGLVVVKVGAGN